jgi:oxepin-CoA hydrolase/3-oxo-5,6-dehydrosuberyl-CoA semialdehyde dehydrogenase
MKILKSYVCGKWVEGTGERAKLVNPTTEEAIAETSTEGVDFKACVEYARERGNAALREMTFAERGKMLAAMSSAVHAHREELVELAIANGGNTRGDAKFDIDGATYTLSTYAALGESLGGAKFLVDGESIQLGRSPRFVGQHIHVPLTGAAVHINAFNFPAWGYLEKAAVALLAGMPVVSKPATSTAVVAARITEILVEANVLPEGALSFVAGPTGDLLDHMTAQDVLAFTGSGETGAKLRGRPHFIRDSIRVNVEADSLNAAVLGPDVDPDGDTYDLFLREVVRDMTQKAGQKCTAIRRIFAPETVVARVRDDLRDRLAEVRVGNPALGEVKMGPVSTADQLQAVREGLELLKRSGETVFGDGGRGQLVGVEGDRGFFVSPVLLYAPQAEAAGAVHEREVFGPVATLMPYSGDAAEAARLVRLGGGGLVSSAYTDDRDWAAAMVLGIAPYHGRVNLGSEKVAEVSPGPGTVLPQLVHGGPGRAGGGEELGGVRGMGLYMQRTAVQGLKPLLEKILSA